MHGVVGKKKGELPYWEQKAENKLHHRLAIWWYSLFIYSVECFGIGELYETLQDIVKFNTRPLSNREIEWAKVVYGDNINYHRVRIDEWALAGPKQQRFCYVSFYLINSWGKMQDSTFIHEMMHIWQYEKMGARYMLQALRAQYSEEGYNYGGIERLRLYLAEGKNLLDFNPEQQADIVTDYFLLINGRAPQWGCATSEDIHIYEKFIENLDK